MTNPIEQSVSEAAASGSRLATLRAMRTRIAAAIDASTTPARDLASLTNRMLDIAKEIEAAEAAEAEEQEAQRKRADGDAALDPALI